MITYLTFARKAFQRTLTYRAAFWTELVINLLFMVMYVCLWRSLFRDRDAIAGYSGAEVMTYVIVAQTVMTMEFTLRIVWELEAKIRSGAIAFELLRPIDFPMATVATAAGPALHTVLFLMIPKLVIFGAAGVLGAPAGAAAALLFAVSLVAAFFVRAALEILVGLMAFWVIEIRGLNAFIIWGVGTLASGYFMPLAFYPDWLAAVIRFLPFQAIVGTPADIYVGRAGMGAVAVQVAWAVGLFLVVRLVFAAARRRLVVQGG